MIYYFFMEEKKWGKMGTFVEAKRSMNRRLYKRNIRIIGLINKAYIALQQGDKFK